MDGSKINTDAAYSVTADQLRAFIERIEFVRAEQAESKEREKEIFAEMKGAGYMTRPVRTIIKLRAQNPDDRAEEEAVVAMYKSALGMS
jgi:uncharacterized protein (UPF0335 family)